MKWKREGKEKQPRWLCLLKNAHTSIFERKGHVYFGYGIFTFMVAWCIASYSKMCLQIVNALMKKFRQ